MYVEGETDFCVSEHNKKNESIDNSNNKVHVSVCVDSVLCIGWPEICTVNLTENLFEHGCHREEEKKPWFQLCMHLRLEIEEDEKFSHPPNSIEVINWKANAVRFPCTSIYMHTPNAFGAIFRPLPFIEFICFVYFYLVSLLFFLSPPA